MFVDAHQGHMPKAFPPAQPLLLNFDLLIGNEQRNQAALDDVDMGRIIALLKNRLAALEDAHFQPAENFTLLLFGDTAEHGNLGKNRSDRFRIFQRIEVAHGGRGQIYQRFTSPLHTH
jgi:hypothetical protein